MGELKFYKFLLLSFVVHLLFAGISLYRSNSYISKQPIIYNQNKARTKNNKFAFLAILFQNKKQQQICIFSD